MNNEQLQAIQQEGQARRRENLYLDLRDLEKDLTELAYRKQNLEDRKVKLVLRALELDFSMHEIAREIGVTPDSLVRIARDNGYEYDTLTRRWIKRPINMGDGAGE